MEIPPVKVDRDFVRAATQTARSRVDKTISLAEIYKKDSRRKARHKAQKCKVCQSGGVLGGAALTFSRCGLCDAETQHALTDVDLLCLACAKENRLCVHCAADIDLGSTLEARPFEMKGIGASDNNTGSGEGLPS